MGHGFGHLWKYYGMVTYRLSPFEQKALKGIINPGFLNTCRRFAENVPYMGPRKFTSSLHHNLTTPFSSTFIHLILIMFFSLLNLAAALIGYLVYEWAEHENHKSHRKNPADYANDV